MLSVTLSCLGMSISVPLAKAASAVQEETRAPAEALRRWQDRRFGMFIHYGPVSLKGTEISWSRAGERRDRNETITNGIPSTVYDQLYLQFNPTKFNAREWVTIAKRAGMKYLRNAIGDLPADRQAEIVAIVNGALSAKQAEVDAAKAALAVRDHDLEVETKAKQEALAQIPALEAQVKAKDAAVQATQAVVTAKTQEVVAYANKAAEQEKQNGSLSALLNKLMWVAGGVALLYLFVHVWLPIVSQSYPQNKLLQTLSAAAVNLTTAHISVPPTSTP